MSLSMSVTLTEGTPGPAERGEAAARAVLQALAELDEINVAIEAETVTFHEVSRAWFGANREDSLPDDLRARFRRAFHDALAQFSDSRGGVETAYYCEHIDVAAALTDIETAARSPASVGAGDRRKRISDKASASAIHIEPLLGQPEPFQCKDLLFDCLDLHYRALEYLGSKSRKICMRRIFAIITSLLGTLDQRAKQKRPLVLSTNEMLSLRSEYAETYAYFTQHAVRRAQMTYFLGMLLGVGLIGALGTGIIITGVDWRSPILLMLGAASVGAVISVMTRLTRGTLTLDGEAGRTMTLLLGMFRPLTGAVFGALAYVLIKGGLLTLGALPDNADPALYYAGLGFAVGFSERAAQIVPDVLPAPRTGGGSNGQVRPDVITQITQQPELPATAQAQGNGATSPAATRADDESTTGR